MKGIKRSERVPGLPRRRLPTVGSEKEKAPYTERELAGDNFAPKQADRDYVRRFVMERHAPVASAGSTDHALRSVTYFGFPGRSWVFEHQLETAWAGVPVYFVGLEWCHPILVAGLGHMPGSSPEQVQIDLDGGRAFAYHTDRARLVELGARAFFTAQLTGPWNHHRRDFWSKNYKRWTCAWLDFTSPLSPEVISSLAHVRGHLCHYAERVPVVVTFMTGREKEDVLTRLSAYTGNPAQRRAALVTDLLGGSPDAPFELLDVRPSRTAHARMLTVAGLCKQPPHAAPPPAVAYHHAGSALYHPAPSPTRRVATLTALHDRAGAIPTLPQQFVLRRLARGDKLLARYGDCPGVFLVAEDGYPREVKGLLGLDAEGWVEFAGVEEGAFEVYRLSRAGRLVAERLGGGMA